MQDTIDWKFLIQDSRAKVYLLWAFLSGAGFAATHYYQHKNINGVWTVISLIGLGYMAKVMPLKIKQMQHIYASWIVPIVIGMTVSGAVFYIDSWAGLIRYLGAFWLIVMATGYFLNGLVDPPSPVYWFAAVINLVVGLLCFMVGPFTEVQYLLAAIVSAWSMLNLWLLRT